jgi:hypothetical protein
MGYEHKPNKVSATTRSAASLDAKDAEMEAMGYHRSSLNWRGGEYHVEYSLISIVPPGAIGGRKVAAEDREIEIAISDGALGTYEIGADGLRRLAP